MEFTPGPWVLQINLFDTLELCERVGEFTRERILVEFEPEIRITNERAFLLPPSPPCKLKTFLGSKDNF